MRANWVKQAVSSGGTGNLTLGSADSGYIDLNTAIGVGPAFEYDILDGSNREIGIGHLSASTTLVRDYVRETLSSGTYTKNSATALNITTSAKVMLAASAMGVPESIPRPCGSAAAARRVPLIQNPSAAGSWATETAVNGYIYAYPVYWPGGRQIGHLYAEVTTAAAGNMRIGLAVPNDDWTSCAVIADTGDISTGATGMVTGTLTTPINLSPGWYIALFTFSAGPTLRAINTFYQQDPWGWDASVAYLKITRRTKSFTYGAFPSAVDLINSTTVQHSGTSMGMIALWAGE